MIVRVVTVVSSGESGELEFDPGKVKDSEALHQVLCVTVPSDNYTVIFRDRIKKDDD